MQPCRVHARQRPETLSTVLKPHGRHHPPIKHELCAYALLVGECQATPKVNGTAGHPLPPTTLAAAMGTWRPPAKDGIRQPGVPKVAQNPPTTITGVAPWAFQTTPPSGASRVARGVRSSRMGAQGKSPPPYTLKRPLPCDSAVPDVSDYR